MINQIIAIILCMIGLIGILFIVSGASLFLGILLAIFGFGSSYSHVKK